MASHESVSIDLVSTFTTDFAAAEPSVQIVHDNGPAPSPVPGVAGEWVRVAVRFTAARAPEIGSRLTDSFGRVVVQVFVPLGVQVGRARELVDTVRDILQRRKIGDARCQEMVCSFSGPDPAGAKFWMETTETRFRFESVPA